MLEFHGEHQYRKFEQRSRKLLSFIVVTWFAVLLGALTLSMTGLGEKWGIDERKLLKSTLLPLFAAWFGINGVGIFWKLAVLIRSRSARPNLMSVLLFVGFLVTGVLFVYLCIVIIRGL